MTTESKHINNILKTEQQIQQAIKNTAKKINEFFNNNESVVVIVILKGGTPFAMELIKNLTFDLYLEFVQITSYKYDKKISKPAIDLTLILKNKTEILANDNCLIIDDLIDTGETIMNLINDLSVFHFKTIAISTLFKTTNYKKIVYPVFSCFNKNPDDFLLGFGLDINGKYRNLPYIANLKR